MTISTSLITTALTRSISAENPTGAQGAGAMATEGTGAHAARELGRGWKVSPSILVAPGESAVLADIDGPGVIRHLWLTTAKEMWRQFVLRIWWDGEERPAVEVPLGDFFCMGWGEFAQVSSQVIAVNPHGGFNSYWEMPFKAGARIAIESLATQGEPVPLYFQVDYELTDVPAQAGYFHAHFRRSNPLPAGTDHTIVPQVLGAGHYAGTYLAWGVNSSGWWGEGELKFFLDGDGEFPTICGTGTEDYFGGAWNFDVPGQGYTPFTTPYLGMPQVLAPDSLYRSQQRFGMYRWHLADPIRFAEELRVTVQALGWRSEGRYLPLHDDIASLAVFYLSSPGGQLESMVAKDELEIL